MEPVPGIIRSKLIPPHVGERVVARPRVAQLIAELSENNRVVLISATAGAGKSTAVVQATELIDRPVAWLTLDATDAAAGRLLVYLEAAISQVVPAAAGVAGAALGARLAHSEAAGLLAEAVGDTRLLLIVDSLEHLAEPEAAHALATLGAFIRYAPNSVHMLLLSRVDVPLDVSSITGFDDVVSVGEEDLSFTPAEAAAALDNAGIIDADPHQVVAATGGWVTGVLFEAWRSREHVTGSGGEVDPLHGYLSSQILSRLTAEERDFLTTTSLLDEVTAERAAALGVLHAADLLVGLRTKHLPVSWTPDAYRMRCHPRFREYLLALLGRHDRDELVRIRSAFGEWLVSSGRHEEAVESFILAGKSDRAIDAAEIAIPAVVDRLDLFVAERWLAELAPQGSAGSRRLAEAELMLAIAREDYRAAVAIADRTQEEGFRELLARASSGAASMMAWSYWHLNRLDDARSVIALAPPSAALDSVHYLMMLVEQPANGAHDFPPPSGGPLDALLMRVNYAHGRLESVLQEPSSPWAAAVSSPWRVGALRATGRLHQALELYRQAEAGNRAPAWLYGMVGPELMIDLRREDEARETLVRGREHIRASGSVVFTWLSSIIEAKLELRLNADAAAASAILERIEVAGARNYGFLAEALDTWSGYVALLQGDAERAAKHLRRAVENMLLADRILDLPTAAVYLAEASWRLGDPDAADAAADTALAAATRQGSRHQLLLALADFPAVATRRLDAEPGTDSTWHEVARSLMSAGFVTELTHRHSIFVAEFGKTTVSVDGEVARPRIAKSLLLLSLLATKPNHEATREEVLGVLFDGRDDDSSKAYLRQAVHRLREVLPQGVGPNLEGQRVTFAEPVAISSESVELQRQVAEASRLSGDAQLQRLEQLITTFDEGEYLPGFDATWVIERREELRTLGSKARLLTAQAAFACEKYQRAEALVEQSLLDDPYQESAWRLLMRIGNAVGDEDRVIDAYRRCRAQLSELGVEPSEATQELFDRLRR